MTENSSIDIHHILSLIPHRYPLLLVDRVEEITLGKSIVGVKNVTFNEPQFMGHFPNNPVMPGVLIVEAMAQTSAILVAKTINSTGHDKTIYFMSINDAKFRKVVKPGDTMKLNVKIEQNRGTVWKFKAEAYVEGELVAESCFTAMVKPN
ncbi:MAG: fabZ [Rickettsiaceae bacterium]|jgi:3-hydroxyacyl-[acyl-carrier-protein] dehydratase|nr:fabZ [Rickettsiaceae bacterium]